MQRCVWLALQLAAALCLQTQRLSPYAVVRTYTERDLDELLARSGSLPRACSDGREHADLVLYYVGDAPEALDPRVERLMGALNGDGCFRNVRHETAGISASLEPAQAMCQQFVKMYDHDPPLWGYSAVFLMQHGMVPLQDDWLHALMPKFGDVVKDDLWMLGGVYSPLCTSRVSNRPRRNRPWMRKKFEMSASQRKDKHINANAIYGSSPEWSNLVHAHGDRCSDEADWDFWLYQRHMSYQLTPKAEKFRQDDIIVDCKPVDPNFVTVPINRTELFAGAVLANTDGNRDAYRQDTSMDIFRKVSDPWGPPDGPKEYPIFWHVPRASGSTIERLVKSVYKMTGMYWHSLRGKWYVSRPGTDDAELGPELGRRLRKVDEGDDVGLISTESLRQVRNILNTQYVGRIFTVLRHPVERLVSAYYFLKRTSWYNLAQRYNTLESFVDSEDCEEDWMCYQLSDLVRLQPHLPTAKGILRDYVLVGLAEKMPETATRFEKYFGWPRSKLMHHKWRRKHGDIFNRSDPLFKKLEKKLAFDMELYNYAFDVFTEQGRMFV